MENYHSNLTIDYNNTDSYRYIDIDHRPPWYDLRSMSNLCGFNGEIIGQSENVDATSHCQETYNQTDSYVPKYESEYQSKWLLEMMTDPKVETLKQEIEARGGSMGFFNISLVWDNTDDLDLSVKCPCCPKIYYGTKTSKCGGKLDMDANVCSNITQVPIENVFWNDHPPNGKYTITVTNFNRRGNDKTPFRCLVRYKDVIKAFDGIVGHKENVVVFDDLIEF